MEINTEEHKIVTLEQAITEGANAFIPYEFEYPNLDLIVEVKLKPITSKDVVDVTQKAKLNPDTTYDIELLKLALFNIDETHFDDEIIEKLPAGVTYNLAAKISEVSGIDLTKVAQTQSVSSEELGGF